MRRPYADLQRVAWSGGLPAPEFRGFGGPKMRAAGCNLDYELTNLG